MTRRILILGGAGLASLLVLSLAVHLIGAAPLVAAVVVVALVNEVFR